MKSEIKKSKCSRGSSPGPRKDRAGKDRKLCWHIFRFAERYELSSDSRYPREKPLQFTRDFVGSGDDDESACHFQQLQILKSKPNYLMLRGAFVELRGIAANRARRFRGFILDQNNQPASNKTIGLWLGVSEKQAGQILSDISEAGLIELVPLPVFKLEKPKNTKAKKGKKARAKKGKTTGKSKKTAGSKSQGKSVSALERPRVTQENTGAPQESSVSLLNKPKPNLKFKSNRNHKVTNIKGDSLGNGKSKREIKNGNAIGKLNALEGKNQEQQKAETLMPEPSKPKEADPGGSVIQFTGPQGSDTRLGEGSSSRSGERSEPQQLGNIARGILHRYNPEAKSFAGDVFQALQLSCHPLSQQGKREAASFAALWQRACHSGLSPPNLAELRERAVAEARRIVKYWHGRRGKPAAVFCTIFNGMLTNAKAKNDVNPSKVKAYKMR